MNAGSGASGRGAERPVSAPLEILSMARATVFGSTPRKPASSRMLGQRLVPRDAAALDDVLELLRQLPADRDRAVLIHTQAYRRTQLY